MRRIIKFLFMNIYVGNLHYEINEDELKGFFEEYGEVTSARVITDKYSGRSKGFGFVDMPNTDEANRAVEELNGAEVKGRPMKVNESQERRERRSNYGDDRRGGGGYKSRY